MKMRMRKAMGSRQRGAETLPGAGMGCPRAGPYQDKERKDSGKVGVRLCQGGVLASHCVHCSVSCGGPFQMLLCLCQPAPRATQKTPESVRALEETESPGLRCHLLPVALYGKQDLFPTAVMEIRTASAPWWFMMLRR